VTSIAVAALIGPTAGMAGAKSPAEHSTVSAMPTYSWPEAHHDSFLTGTVTDPSITASNAATLGVKWMTFMGNEALSSPVVAWNGALSETLVYTGNESGLLVAYDQANGLPVWSFIDQSSIVKFIEQNWGLPGMGNGAADNAAGSLDTLFNFQGPTAQRLFLNPSTGE
jgi:hypothetical protein